MRSEVVYPKIEHKLVGDVSISNVRFEDTVELNEASIIDMVDAEILGTEVCTIHELDSSATSSSFSFTAAAAAASSSSSWPASPQSSPRDQPSLSVSGLPVFGDCLAMGGPPQPTSKLLSRPSKKAFRSDNLAASAFDSNSTMVFGDMYLSNNNNNNNNSNNNNNNSNNNNNNNNIVRPRSINGQYYSSSLSSNSNSSARSASSLVGAKNKSREINLSNSSSPVKPPSKRSHGNSIANQKLIDALKMADAYDYVGYFDPGRDVRASISLATANSVNKYHMIPMQEQAEYNNKIKELSKHSVNIALPDVYEEEDEEGVVGSGDGEDGSGGDPSRSVNNSIGLLLTASHTEQLKESMNLKKQKEEEKKLRAAEKENKEKADALILNTLKVKYLAEYNACSPDVKVNFASVRLSKVNVPELAKIYKAFTGKGRGDLNSRDLLLAAIMDQLRRK